MKYFFCEMAHNHYFTAKLFISCLAAFFTYSLQPIWNIGIRLIFPNHSSDCQDDVYPQPLPWTEIASYLEK